jgi:mannose-6-phosphate isomerase-like protein (cupin superfamily)
MLTAPVTQGSPMLERDSEHAVMIDGLHKGKGRVSLRRFGFENAQAPAGFVTFVIPPGASEGVHTHGIGLPAGPFDEYYYVMAGAGEMSMDGQVMPVKEGDHVHAPMGVAHGIENTMPDGDLKVLVTYVRRA